MELKGHTDFSYYCSLPLLAVTQGLKGLYLWVTNVSLTKYFKAHPRQRNVIRIHQLEKAKTSFKVRLLVG